MRSSVKLFVMGVALMATLLVIFGGAAVSAGRAGSTGPELTVTVSDPLPATVTPGENIAYFIRVVSRATSNITHLSITAPAPAASGFSPFTFVTSDHPDICASQSNTLTCNVGTFPPASDVTIKVVFNVPITYPNDTTTTASFTAGASYSGGSNNTNSTRTNGSNSVDATVGTLQDLTKGFVLGSSGDVFETVPLGNGASPGNQQSTKATEPADAALGFGVVGTVQDQGRTDTTTDCGPGFSCWGQSSYVSFLDADGNDITLPSNKPGSVVIRTDTTEIPPGVNKNNIQWFHNGQGPLPTCSGTVPPNGCVKSVQKLGDNDLLTTIQALHHGFYRP
jgi:hypothetical protein